MTRVLKPTTRRQAAATKEAPDRASATADAVPRQAPIRAADGPRETVDGLLRRAETLGHPVPTLLASRPPSRPGQPSDEQLQRSHDALAIAGRLGLGGDAGLGNAEAPGAPGRSPRAGAARVRSPDVIKSQAVSLAKLQEIGRTQTGFHAFSAPVPTDVESIEEFRAQYGEASGWGVVTVLGITTTPTSFSAPLYQIDIKRSGRQAWDFWYPALEILADAFEGNITAFYVKPGKHYTGKNLKDGRPINLLVSDEMSEWGRMAEIEHIDDYRYAYDLTLGAAQIVLEGLEGDLRTIRSDTPEGGGSLSEWYKKQLEDQARTEIAGHLLGLGSDPEAWGYWYENRFQRSGLRDQRGWHTMVPGGVDPRPLEGLLTAKVTSTTRIGEVSSAEVVGWNSQL